LLIDLGTNSEIWLAVASRLWCASAASGPAFEGGGVACGVRAGEGAIDALHFETDGRLSLHVIGGGAARGLCGSGVLDLVAEFLRVGLIDATGYLRRAQDVPAAVPETLRSRIQEYEGGRGVVVVPAGDAGGAVTVRAADIRQIQLAVAAIRAGIEVLCLEAGVSASGIDAIDVAGAFGQFVRKSSLLRLGLLPAVPAERVHVVGNAAGAGARLALIDERARDRAKALPARTTYVELAGRADYAEWFGRCLAFPGRGDLHDPA
jgi:uncharacterized 2Fe-2S/4Fe-4S cluster protein (DUF4445 family)